MFYIDFVASWENIHCCHFRRAGTVGRENNRRDKGQNIRRWTVQCI